MRKKQLRKKMFIAEGILIAALLIVLVIVSHRPENKSSSKTDDGRSYIASETAKDPVKALEIIRMAKETAQPEENSETDSAQSAEMVPDILQDLQAQIDTMQIRELSAEEIAALRQRFDTTVVVGDSMTQAVLDYDFLDENHVKYQRSTSISELYDRTQEALAMLPQRIIFFTGLYDVDVFENPEDFYQAYLDRMNQVWSVNPDVRIYICSLLPPSDPVAEWREDLARSPLYNAQLQQLCDDTDANYIDTNWMVRQELYLEDGIHFNYDFYTIWIQYAALAAGI